MSCPNAVLNACIFLVYVHRPAKVVGPKHPDVIVETASLASVEPPDPKYEVHPVLKVRTVVLSLTLKYFIMSG